MSLQRRLILFFVVIVVVPLAAAGFVVQRLVAGEITARSSLVLGPALDAVTAIFNERAAVLEELVENAVDPRRLGGALEERDRATVDGLLAGSLVRAPRLDFLVVRGAGGNVLGSAFRPGDFVEGFIPPGETELLSTEATGAGFAKVTVPLRRAGGNDAGSVIGGFWLDGDLLVGGRDEEVHLSIVAEGEVIATTARVARPVPVNISLDQEPFETRLDEDVTAEARPIDDGTAAIMASTPRSPGAALSTRVLESILGLLALAVVGTSVLAFALARLITQPLEELALGAEAISEGRFDHRIPVRSRDEVGRLALAFNDMTKRLHETVTELRDSRDLLQRAVRRVGETLRSTHDMTQMLEAILDTAADAVDADAAVLWRFTPTRDQIYPALRRGLREEEVDRIGVGEGVAGLVAERSVRILVPSETSSVFPSDKEPPHPVVAAVPLYSQHRVTGVISVYRSADSSPFTAEDLDAVSFLAEQGGVAIENVVLHEEAQRLSLTDGLTGVFNRRYFQMQFRQLLATAIRFERPFSVLMLDLDHFKIINDTHGHQRGDAILIEFSQRVSSVLREVDTFSRYGGEEFIALLSETGLSGALSTADKIIEVIGSEPFGAEGEVPIDLTVSIGISCYPEHGDSFGSLVEAADQALYAAKQAGRNRAEPATGPPTGLRLA